MIVSAKDPSRGPWEGPREQRNLAIVKKIKSLKKFSFDMIFLQFMEIRFKELIGQDPYYQIRMNKFWVF